MIKKLVLYYNTIKYLKPVQIYGRIFSLIKKKTISKRISLKESPNYSPLKPKTPFLRHDPWNTKEELLKGNFTFLNHTEKLYFPPQWDNQELPLLWQFNLHYMNYLHLLDHDGKEKLVLDWINHNHKGGSVSWHPYVISLRLVSLLKEKWNNTEIINSIALQAEYLYKNLEYYHPANHYLENGRALIFTGLSFKESTEGKKWYKKGKEIYYKELPKQVIEDGCYFEKSPMYHNIILHGLLDLLNILNEEDEFYLFIKEYLEKMLQFTNKLSFTNGSIPLFNDSTHEIAPRITYLNKYYENILNHASIQSFIHAFSSHLSDKSIQTSSGYYICKIRDIELIADFGTLGPDSIPAHAHADIFTYELYYKGLPFIIDTGVYEYQNGEMRDYCRSTKAHNTISIDGKDQAEMWGGFRVGKRYQPENVEFTETDSKKILSGEFKGWSKLIGDKLTHKRIIETSDNYIKIIDEVTGEGEHLIENFIHLHPDVEIKESDEKIELINNEVILELKMVNSKYSIENGFFFPEFGKKLDSKVIRLHSTYLPTKFEYVFRF